MIMLIYYQGKTAIDFFGGAKIRVVSGTSQGEAKKLPVK